MTGAREGKCVVAGARRRHHAGQGDHATPHPNLDRQDAQDRVVDERRLDPDSCLSVPDGQRRGAGAAAGERRQYPSREHEPNP